MGTQYIKAQVHLVATDKAEVGKHPIWRGLVTKMLYDGRSEAANFSNCIPQHLYFTTDEDAKDADWVLPNAPWDNKPWKYKKAPCPLPYWGGNKDSYRKIVATTNPELSFNAGQKHIGQVPPHERFPMIDTPFIEAYIKAYNEGNSIKEVLLEIEEYAIGSYGLFDGEPTIDTRVKLRPNGSVIIHPVKERMYSEEQVRRMLMGFNPTTKSSIARLKEVEDYMDAYYPE